MFYNNIPEQNALIIYFFPRWDPGVTFCIEGPHTWYWVAFNYGYLDTEDCIGVGAITLVTPTLPHPRVCAWYFVPPIMLIYTCTFI